MGTEAIVKTQAASNIRIKPIDPNGPLGGFDSAVSLVNLIIEQKVEQLGGERALGGLDRKERSVWYFRNGSCVAYERHSKHAFQVKGDIFKKWLALGGMNWGVPDTDETATPDGVGRFNHFAGNTKSIYWTPRTGAFEVHGEIRRKWAELGWERSPVGYPVTDESGTPDGVGRFNHFSNGGSIYWTPGTGAHAVWGDIRKRWQQLGWERSYLGYPTSDEDPFPDNGRANTFQNGGIYWWPDTGAIDLRDVVLHYTGLYCFKETSYDQSSNSDEPYVIIGIATPQTNSTVRTRTYSDVDDREARPDLIELYRGKPYGVTIGTVMMEHDFGDQNRYLKQVQDIVMAAHQAGTAALGLIPIVGPAIAAVAGPALGSLMPSIGAALNNLFNWGDDRIGSGNFTISARDMVLLATRTGNSTFHGIGYKAQSPMIRGTGAAYQAYFGLVPL